MATSIIMRRVGSGLFPVGREGVEALERVTLDKDVKVVVKQTRNPAHHRKMFALLSRVQENCSDRYPTVEWLLTALKIATGHVDTIITKSGDTVYVPRSIDFANMSQDAFEPFYNKCIEIICRDILPGLNNDDLARELETA